MNKKLYIAYGSNMDEEQMRLRCPNAKLLGKSTIYGYRLLFKGSLTGAYATIEKDENGCVPVLLWEIAPSDEARLDRYEGFPNFYYKKDLPVKLGRVSRRGMAYIMHESRRFGEPWHEYYALLESAYQRYGFDLEILEDAWRFSVRNAKHEYLDCVEIQPGQGGCGNEE